MQHIPAEKKELLYHYLTTFITNERKERIEKVISERTRHFTMVLEDLYQPHNASAVLRSCECFGIQDVHIIENNNPYAVNPDVALGASNWIDLFHYNANSFNTPECFEKLKNNGYTIVATTPHENSFFLGDINVENKTAFVFGTEKNGLTDYAMKNADQYLKIPMYGFTESLNISVTAALTIFHAIEKLKKSTISWQLSLEEQLDIKIRWIKQNLRDGDLIAHNFLKTL